MRQLRREDIVRFPVEGHSSSSIEIVVGPQSQRRLPVTATTAAYWGAKWVATRVAGIIVFKPTTGQNLGWWRMYFHLVIRSEEHTSELQSLMRISYAVFCLKKKNKNKNYNTQQ